MSKIHGFCPIPTSWSFPVWVFLMWAQLKGRSFSPCNRILFPENYTQHKRPKFFFPLFYFIFELLPWSQLHASSSPLSLATCCCSSLLQYSPLPWRQRPLALPAPRTSRSPGPHDLSQPVVSPCEALPRQLLPCPNAAPSVTPRSARPGPTRHCPPSTPASSRPVVTGRSSHHG